MRFVQQKFRNIFAKKYRTATPPHKHLTEHDHTAVRSIVYFTDHLEEISNARWWHFIVSSRWARRFGKEVWIQLHATVRTCPYEPLVVIGKKRRSYVHLTEGVASLGIMGDQFRAYLETPRTSQHLSIEGLKGGPQLGPHYAERCYSHSCSSGCKFL